ncbi:extracellular solute-binding protein [Paenibacillus sp. TRM 82003]|nr:extracellular solute-binding protein [Paenibacillus sp. TRM 82003]
MKRWNKHASTGLAIAMLATTALACSSEGATTDTPPSSTDTPAPQNGESAAPSLMAEAGFPIVNEPVALKVFARRAPPNGPYEEMLVFKTYEQMTGVDIEWEDVPTEGFAERKNLLFAANELPDALYKAGITPLEAVKYGSSGMLIPLEGLIDAHAPNITKLFEEFPEIKASITAPDGHIYALPGIVTLNAGRTDKHWMNQAWLESLNLKAPTTTEELVNVLRAFRDNDPNGNGQKDEIPFSTWDLPSLITQTTGFFGLQNQMGYRIMIENDKVDIWYTDDRYKQTLEFLHQLYQEKLLDQAIFTQQASDYVGKMGAGNLGYFFNQASDPFAARKDDFVGIAPVQGPNDKTYAHSSPVARDFGTFAITSMNQYPEVTMRWIDYFYGEEGAVFARYGVEGETFDYKADGKPEYTEAILTDSRGTGTTIGQFAPWPGGGAPHWINIDNSSAINPSEVQAAQEALDPYLPEQIFGAPLFDEQTAQDVDTLRQDIDTFFEESSAKFITGSLSFDKWGEYVDTLEKMNLAQLEAFYQDAYDKTK